MKKLLPNCELVHSRGTGAARLTQRLLLATVTLLLLLCVAPSRALAGETYSVKVDKGYLALRTAPAYDYSNEIGELYTGDVVTVEEKPSGNYWWVYSSKYGRSGYVNKNYLVKI